VYEALDPLLSRKVALKVLRRDFLDKADRGDLEARLLREAQALARLAHPNVVAVHDVGHTGDQVFLAMDFVPGTTLDKCVRAGEPGWQESRGVRRGAGRGLAAAHAGGVIHRAFKPANVLVGQDGRVCVTDFGLARVTGTLGPEARAAVADAALDEPVDGRLT